MEPHDGHELQKEPYRFDSSKLTESTRLLECMKQLKQPGLSVAAAMHDQDISDFQYCLKQSNGPNVGLFAALVRNSELL